MLNVVFMMTVHGRSQSTLALVRQILTSAPKNWCIEIVINVDGKHEETTALMTDVDKKIHLLMDYEDSYWAKGMWKAENYIKKNLKFDYLIWVNNDISLNQDALKKAAEFAKDNPDGILAGSFVNSKNGRKSYGGSTYPKFRSFNWYKSIPISNFPVTASIANGNFLLFKKEIYQILGGINGEFLHGNADSEISLRANRIGIPIYVIPGCLGICDSNPRYFNRSLFSMYSHEFSRKRTPWVDIKRLCRTQYSNLWMVLYLDFLLAIFVRNFIFWSIRVKKIFFPNQFLKK